jgi:membrane-bound ClpP family serine protease
VTLLGISSLILLGIVLILVEIFFIPGLGFVGIVGFLLILLGIYFAYDLNTNYGHIALVAGALVSAGLGVLAFRENTWIRLGVKSNIIGKSKGDDTFEGLSVGMKGLALGRIAPIGKAKFERKIIEVKAFNNIIENKEVVEILKIEDSSVVVIKSKNNESIS